MKKEKTKVRKLYLMQLSETSVPMGGGKTLEMSSGCYLLEMENGGHILIDSGMAPDGAGEVPAGTPKARNEKNVLEHLGELGIWPREIDMVICTHFDVDHAGYHDHFEKSEFVVQRKHYELAKGGHPRYAKARAHWDNPRLKYRLVDGDTKLFSGVELLETSGHCIGHQSVLVRMPNSGPVLLAIDAVILRRLFTVERKAGPFDENQRLLLKSTQKLLDIANREDVKLVVFGHDGEAWRTLKRAPESYE